MITAYVPRAAINENAKKPMFCINCDGKTDFEAWEQLDGTFEAVCKKCKEPIYVPQINDYNCEVRQLEHSRKALKMWLGIDGD